MPSARGRGGSAKAQTWGKGKGHERAGVKAARAALPERVVTEDALLAQRERCRLIGAQQGAISSC